MQKLGDLCICKAQRVCFFAKKHQMLVLTCFLSLQKSRDESFCKERKQVTNILNKEDSFFVLVLDQIFIQENIGYFFVFMGERRGSNPRVMESQSIALPLGYARHKDYSLFYQLFPNFSNERKRDQPFGGRAFARAVLPQRGVCTLSQRVNPPHMVS